MEKSRIYVDSLVHKNFKSLAKDVWNLEIGEGVELVLKFCIKYNIHPENLESVWNKNVKGEIEKYHNNTVGFLKTLEETQLLLLDDIAEKNTILMQMAFSTLINSQTLISKTFNSSDASIIIKQQTDALTAMQMKAEANKKDREAQLKSRFALMKMKKPKQII